jgi:retinol dehydrogenase 12
MSGRRIGILSQLVPPKTDWTEEKVPDQQGKTVIITGGNIGIGKETARVRFLFPQHEIHFPLICNRSQVLLSKGAKVYIATRSADKAQAAIDDLKANTGKESVFFLKLNLADLDSVKTAAEEFIRKEPELHTLYNNR